MDPTNEISEYLKRLQNGDECLKEFVNAVTGYIKFFAYHYLVDKSFVDDVVNSTFFKILDNIEDFDESRGSGKAWIGKIAQNEAYTINSNERKHAHVSLDEINEETVCTSDDSKKLEFAAAFDNALNKLDEIDRQIMEWRIYDDLTFEKIAERLNMYVSTAHKRYKKCLKQIVKEIL